MYAAVPKCRGIYRRALQKALHSAMLKYWNHHQTALQKAIHAAVSKCWRPHRRGLLEESRSEEPTWCEEKEEKVAF